MIKLNKDKALLVVSPIHQAFRQITLYLGSLMKGFDIGPEEGHLLAYLYLYGPCSVGELLRVFGHKNSTMTSILDRLSSRDYVKREVNPEDRRSFIISTTAKGSRMGGRARVIAQSFDRSIGRRVGREDMKGFERVVKAIAEITQVTVSDKQKRNIRTK